MLKNVRKSRFGVALAALAAFCVVSLEAPLARAQVSPVSPAVAVTAPNVQLGGTSPASATTTVGTTSIPLDAYSKCVINARLVGATGGTLDVYIQSSVSQGASGGWYDVVHFPQLAAAAAAVGYVVTLTRGHSLATAAAAPLVTPTVVNAVDGTPVLAVNTVVPGGLGNALRVVFVAGVSTSAGGAETVQAICSTL